MRHAARVPPAESPEVRVRAASSSAGRGMEDRLADVPETFAVVVCAYTLDRWPEIEAAVASLRRQVRLPDEVILVCDHNDELLARARSAFPDVRCIPNRGRQGLSDRSEEHTSELQSR